MSSVQQPHIGAVFIAYNAAKTLEKFYNEFPKSLVKTIILVDDASTDNTYELAQKLGIQAYKNPVNLGYGGNMKRALELARELGMDIIIDLHPDGEYSASSIPEALEEIKNGADFVLGNRLTSVWGQIQSGMLIWKVLPILILNSMARITLNTKLHDLHQGFRVYTKKMLSCVNYEENSDGYLFSFELIVQALYAGFKITEVPVKTNYTGKKRGARLKHSILYTLGVVKILGIYILARLGFESKLFRRPLASRDTLSKISA